MPRPCIWIRLLWNTNWKKFSVAKSGSRCNTILEHLKSTGLTPKVGDIAPAIDSIKKLRRIHFISQILLFRYTTTICPNVGRVSFSTCISWLRSVKRRRRGILNWSNCTRIGCSRAEVPPSYKDAVFPIVLWIINCSYLSVPSLRITGPTKEGWR